MTNLFPDCDDLFVGLRLLFVHGEEGDRHGFGRVVFHLVRVVARNRLINNNNKLH